MQRQHDIRVCTRAQATKNYFSLCLPPSFLLSLSLALSLTHTHTLSLTHPFSRSFDNTDVYIYIYIYRYIYIYIHIYIYAYKNVKHKYTYIQTYTCTHAFVYMHVIHIHTHICIHILTDNTGSKSPPGYYLNLMLRIMPLPGDALEFFERTPEAVLRALRDKDIVSTWASMARSMLVGWVSTVCRRSSETRTLGSASRRRPVCIYAISCAVINAITKE